MGMDTCRVCGKGYPDLRPYCPHCGARLPCDEVLLFYILPIVVGAALILWIIIIAVR